MWSVCPPPPKLLWGSSVGKCTVLKSNRTRFREGKVCFCLLNNHNSFVICTVDWCSRVWFSFGANPAGVFFYHLHARAGKRGVDITLQPSDTLSINSNLRRRVVIGSVPIAKRGHLLRNWVRRPFENNITPLLDMGATLSVSHYIFLY